jgi:hypothetical protein
MMKRRLTVNPSGDADDEPLLHVVRRSVVSMALLRWALRRWRRAGTRAGSSRALMDAWKTSSDDNKDNKEVPTLHPFSWLSACFKPRQPCSPRPHHEKVPNQSTLLQPLLRALKAAQTPLFPLATDPKQAYALGLFTFQLPTTEMNVVTNTDVIITPYRIGAHSPSMTVVGHTGELGGFLSAYWTFHDEGSAVVVH